MIAHAPQLAPPPPRDSELGAPQRRPKLWAMRQHLLASGHHTALVWTLSGKSLCICLHLNSKWDGLIYFKQLVGCYVYRYKCSELLEPGNQASRNLPAVSLLRGTNNPFWGVLASSARQGISLPSHSRCWHLQKPLGDQKFNSCPTCHRGYSPATMLHTKSYDPNQTQRPNPAVTRTQEPSQPAGEQRGKGWCQPNPLTNATEKANARENGAFITQTASSQHRQRPPAHLSAS